MGTDCKLNIIFAKLVSTPGGPSIFVPLNSSGTGGGTAFSNAVACDIAFYPGGAMSRPGHVFTWGAYITGIVGDLIQTALHTALTNFATALIAPIAMTVGTMQYGTYTRKTKTFTPATHFNVKPKLTGLNKRTKPLY
jgi:hypothetical protein